MTWIPATLLGFLWGADAPLECLASITLIPTLWALASHAHAAGLVLLLYALAATRGLIPGIATFFEVSCFLALALWLLSNAPFYLLGRCLWLSSFKMRSFCGIPLLLFLWTAPPFMFIGWANPLLAVGLFFPSHGFAGIFMMLILLIAFTLLIKASLKTAFLLCFFIIIYLNQSLPFDFKKAPGFHAQHTFLTLNQAETHQQILQRHRQLMQQLQDSGALIHVFPESVGGFWDDYLAFQWRYFLEKEHPNKTVLLGAYRKHDGRNEGIMVKITRDRDEIVYVQRLPMTGGMLNPFSNDGFKLNLFNTPLNTSFELETLTGKLTVDSLICFEYVVMLPILITQYNQTDVLIAPTSLWWAPEQLQRAQHQSLQLAALWLNIPVVSAINGSKIEW